MMVRNDRVHGFFVPICECLATNRLVQFTSDLTGLMKMGVMLAAAAAAVAGEVAAMSAVVAAAAAKVVVVLMS